MQKKTRIKKKYILLKRKFKGPGLKSEERAIYKVWKLCPIPVVFMYKI